MLYIISLFLIIFFKLLKIFPCDFLFEIDSHVHTATKLALSNDAFYIFYSHFSLNNFTNKNRRLQI